jgi:hypothetical protein
MSDDSRNAGKNAKNAQHDEPGDEVEAHAHNKNAANQEPAQEGDDEVEAHGHGIKKSGPDFKNA